MKDIKALSEKVVYKRMTYQLLERTDKKAMYQHLTGDSINGYEVFSIKVIDQHKLKNSLSKFKNQPVSLSSIPQYLEQYPRDEDFGKSAWYCKTLSKAKDVYNGL